MSKFVQGGKEVKYLTYLSVRALKMPPIHVSTSHIIFVACVDLMEAIF